MPGQPPTLGIFISHSTRDVTLARALVDLLRTAVLGLTPDRIRCTSVEGYGLPAGASVSDILKDDVNAAQILIGLLTPNSLASSYVLFELGARWGAGLVTFPALAGGLSGKDRPGPLGGVNAIRLAEPRAVLQLASDIAQRLELTLARPETYERHVNTVTRLASVARAASRRPPSPVADLTTFADRTAAARDLQAEIGRETAFVYLLTGRGSDLDSQMFAGLLENRKANDRREFRILLRLIKVPPGNPDWLEINDRELRQLTPALTLNLLRKQIQTNAELFESRRMPWVNVKHFNAPQVGRIVLLSRVAYFNPYLPHARGKSAPVCRCSRESALYTVLMRYFDLCWESAIFYESLAAKPSPEGR